MKEIIVINPELSVEGIYLNTFSNTNGTSWKLFYCQDRLTVTDENNIAFGSVDILDLKEFQPLFAEPNEPMLEYPQ